MENVVTIDISNLPTDVPVALGYSLSVLLYGILVVQAFIYYTRFTKDSKWLRLYILVLFVLETFSVTVVLYEMLQGARLHCLSCIPLSWASSWDLSWSFRTLSALTGFISLLAHGFYCWRIKVLSGCWYIPVFVMLTSLLQCIFISIGTMSSSVIQAPDVISDVWGIASVVCDFVITIETTRLLLRRKNSSPIRETSSLIARLISLTCETGAVTAGSMLLQFLLSKYDTTNDIIVSVSAQEIDVSQWPYSSSIAQLSIFYSMSRLYANCLLASLNARLIITKDSVHLEPAATVLFDRNEIGALVTAEQSTEHHINVVITRSRFTTSDSGTGARDDADVVSAGRSEKQEV